jgi:hypothetical protein
MYSTMAKQVGCICSLGWGMHHIGLLLMVCSICFITKELLLSKGNFILYHCVCHSVLILTRDLFLYVIAFEVISFQRLSY